MKKTHRFKIYKWIFPVILWTGLVSGCAIPDHLSNGFGRSFNQILHTQIINPVAPENPAASDGLPGVIAEKNYTRYKE